MKWMVEHVRSGHRGKIGVVCTFIVMKRESKGSGETGRVATPVGLGWLTWCGPAPQRLLNSILSTDAYDHSTWMNYSGIWTPEMVSHLSDLPIWTMDLGYPLMTLSSAGRPMVDDNGEADDHHEVLWGCSNGPFPGCRAWSTAVAS